ncbi:uncharacterized protein LOC142528355 [Primulina tabacum]|uniref:uncharacterized protein LOC142528355 n=1 Tax=Primulina tabacum TaxID=48773 RepID=UPI003F5AD343
MVQQKQFAGTATSDPHVHLRTFLEITDTIKINNVPDDIIRLRLFPFCLRDQARGWLQSLPLGSITTWQELATKFLAKYFPPAKSAQLKIEISTFRQTDFEQLYEAWERYKELLRKCPNHGFEDWVQIELFYNGLNGQTRGTVDAAAGGTIFAKSAEQAYDLLEQMTINSYQWPSERAGVKRTAGVYAVDPITSLTAQVSALTTQLAAMKKVSISETESPSTVAEEQSITEEAQYVNNRNFGGFGGYRGREEKEVELTHVRDEKLSPTKGARGKKSERYGLNQCIDISLLLYPQRFLQLQDEFQKKKGLEDLKNLNTNIEFADQVEGEFTKGTRRNVPQKLLDPGEFIVPCEIGGHLVEKAICDSGASINIMPRSLYEKLGLIKMRSTELSVQLADKSLKVPLGIVDDVELKIDKLKVLAEFLVLDMENSQDVHVILGRPLLAAVGAMIDVKRGKMTMEVESQLVEIRVSKKSYDPP